MSLLGLEEDRERARHKVRPAILNEMLVSFTPIPEELSQALKPLESGCILGLSDGIQPCLDCGQAICQRTEEQPLCLVGRSSLRGPTVEHSLSTISPVDK
jgi:hypothetical protein